MQTAVEELKRKFDGTSFVEFRKRRIETFNTHGTGCTYSSAIATNLAKGMGVSEAVREAKTA